MNYHKIIPIILTIVIFSFCNSNAQNNSDIESSGKSINRFSFGLNHQHQKFFNKAFSFQGIEADYIFKDKFIVGAYGSSFVSNFQTEISNQNTFLVLSQAGIVAGFVGNKSGFIHPGVITNIGYLSIAGDNAKLSLFNSQNPEIKTHGLVIAPQVFAEFVVVKWIKIRTGLGYNFYRINGQSVIKNTDLQDIAFTFGFFFGKFR